MQVELSNIQKKFEEATRKLEEKINVLDGGGPFMWKIDYGELIRKAFMLEQTDLYSPEFYRYGYKFKLNANPNAYGDGKNTHLSIFMIIMKGENDSSLTWPFNKKVTFTVIDQQEDENARENIVVCFNADPSLRCFARPKGSQNEGWGHHDFYELRKRRYIVDDTIFIQVQIASP